MDLYRKARESPSTLRGQGRVLSAASFAGAGISPTATRWRARRGRLVRMHRGVYVVGVGAPDLLDRIHAVLQVCPPEAVLGFHTAAALLGFGVPEDGAVHVVVPAGSPVPHRPGVRVHESVLPFEPVTRLGVPCTPPARTAIDLARCLDRPAALAVLDAALFARACKPADLAAEATLHAALRGIRQARELVALADGRAECKQDSHLRLILHDGRVPGFEAQVEVYDSASRSPFPQYRIDLANRERRVGVEYDGEYHTGRLSEDRRRHNRLCELGWRMRYFTSHELYRDPGSIIRTVRRALTEGVQRGAGTVSPGCRRW